MMDIFNFFGSILGYLLWFFYTLIPNYGVAIILFTIATKIIVFPFSIKQQKSMAATSKLSLKQQELQKKYGNDKAKYQQEVQKMYEKEGVNPASGCLTSIVPLIIMMGLFYTVQNPLANALHLSGEAVGKAVEMLKTIPGIGSTFNAQYAQVEIVKHFAQLQPHLTMFNGDEQNRIALFSHGFQFLGLNLLDSPASGGDIFGTLFRSNLWVIPVLSLVSSIFMQFIMNKLQPGMQQAQQGCMKYMLYIMPLFTAWIACTVPAAVGFYWIISTLTSTVQSVAMNIWYSPADLNAKAEAQRIALREQEEANRKPIQVSLPTPAAQKAKAPQASPAKNSGKPAKQKNKKSDSSDYLGSKK